MSNNSFSFSLYPFVFKRILVFVLRFIMYLIKLGKYSTIVGSPPVMRNVVIPNLYATLIIFFRFSKLIVPFKLGFMFSPVGLQ